MVLSRYIAAEIAKPLVLGVSLLVIVFTGYSSAVRLGQASEGFIELPAVARLIGLNTIVALEVLLPTALYLSIISSVSRFYRDSEMAAMRAAGVGETRILRSTMLLSLAIAVLVGFISIYGRPWAYREIYRIEAEARAEFDIRKIQPRQFIELQDSKYVLFARDVDKKTGGLEEVFLQTELGDKVQVLYAQEAFLPPVRFGEARSFQLFDGHGYLLDRLGHQDITLRYKEMVVHIPTEQLDTSYRRKAEPTLNLYRSDAPKDVAEFQWRLSTPLATLTLALLAVPLSRSAPREGRHRSFFLAILVYVGLFNMTSVARTWVEDERIRAFPGIWWVYVFPLALFAVLMIAPRWAHRNR
ncbi:MAG: LPS export ABC transporter permease LptF [Gammaproteobacteria bacterium]